MIGAAEVHQAFLQALSDADIQLQDPTDVKLDGEKHRTKVAGDKRTNLVYQIYMDDRPAGWFEDYKRGVFVTFSAGNDNKPLTAAERKKIEQAREEARQQREAEKLGHWRERAAWCQGMWEEASEEGVLDHPYARRKGWTDAGMIRRIDQVPRGLFFEDDEKTGSLRNLLVAPIFSIDGTLWAVQVIDADGTKLFPKGCKKQGNFHPIKGRPDIVIECEGIATGKALARATGYSVLCCLDANNLIAVDAEVAEHMPERARIVAPDNDHADPKNPGLSKAQSLATPLLIPPFTSDTPAEHSDWDDWLRHHGTDEDLQAMLAEMLREPEPEPDYEAMGEQEPPHIPEEYEPPPEDNIPPAQQPFRVLGWDRGDGFYLPSDSRQVVALPASAHTKLNLMALAPLSWWAEWFPSEKRSGDGIDWTMAADSLMRRAKARGVFDPDMVRGRGAWWDQDRPVVHLGDRVIIDGESFPIETAPSDYVYEATRPIRIATDRALTNSEAHKFIEICERLRWEKSIFGKLVAGWIFLAPICGALQWRPHIWITGEASSGKSTVMTHVIGRSLRRNMLFAQGDTSEAGVRQSLGSDAIPVVFDEFESERRKAAARVEDVMALVTQASSETGAKLYKGGQNGRATSYQIRSMFAFSSIAVSIKQHAAKTRITVLSLRTAGEETPEGLAQYQKLMEDIHNTLTPEYIDRMQARAVQLIPVIRHNAEVFAEAGAMVLKTRRLGDQIGALLAGAYALHSTAKITRDKAKAWLEQQDWSSETEDTEQTDKDDCLAHISSTVIRMNAGEFGKPIERTIAELVTKAVMPFTDATMMTHEAEDVLGRNGIRVERNERGEDVMIIANGHKAITRILKETPWESSYARTLLRIPGAERSGPKYFKGPRCRGVSIPIGHVVDTEYTGQ